ncbi:MAG: hypothetical protein HY294_01190 [Candidatus Rokubacteria bacterium]|nr:hypothetical protein [Candidatus Rokubacteria bacterium]
MTDAPLVSPAPAREGPPPSAGLSRAAAYVEPPTIRLGLYLEFEHFSYLGGAAGKLVGHRNALTAIPKVDWTPLESVLLHLALTLRKDFSEEERSRVYPYEGYVNVEREGWSARVGRQFITWGRADTLRPTDVFKRHDLTDLIEDREEAIDAVKLDLVRGGWTLESVWAPVFDPDIVSFRPENRWTGLPTQADLPGVGRVGLTFREDRTQRPPATLGSGQVGARLGGSARGWDFAAMYYYGYDRIPTVIRREITTIDPVARDATITLVPTHQRIHVMGGDFATAMAGWGIRGEAAYTLTRDVAGGVQGINDPYLRFTGGVDRTFTRLPLGESLLVVLQYALDTEPRPRGPLTQQEVDPRLHPFRHAVTAKSTWKYDEFIRLSAKGYVNLEQGDFVIQPEISWQPRDAMMLVVGGDVIGGRRSTFFGQFRDNDRIRFRVSYSF